MYAMGMIDGNIAPHYWKPSWQEFCFIANALSGFNVGNNIFSNFKNTF